MQKRPQSKAFSYSSEDNYTRSFGGTPAKLLQPDPVNSRWFWPPAPSREEASLWAMTPVTDGIVQTEKGQPKIFLPAEGGSLGV